MNHVIRPPEPAQRDKAELFRRLHTQPQLLELSNVWDVTSARAVAGRPGTTAIATASAAIAASHGYEDGEHIPWALHLACLQRICAAVTLPVTVDIERGYGDPVATVRDVVRAGAVGVNLEDALSPVAEFAATITAIAGTAANDGVPLMINARTDEYLLSSSPSLTSAIDRCHAYLDAGADCVFVPGLTDADAIAALVSQVGRQRIILLALPGIPTAAELERLGVARLSCGPALHDAVATFIGAWGSS